MIREAKSIPPVRCLAVVESSSPLARALEMLSVRKRLDPVKLPTATIRSSNVLRKIVASTRTQRDATDRGDHKTTTALAPRSAASVTSS